MSLNSKMYDILKWITLIVLPAIATLYMTLGSVWGFPYTDQVGATITALVTFLGAVLQISRSNYTGDGTLTINTSNPDTDKYNLELNDLEGLTEKKSVTFMVKSE